MNSTTTSAADSSNIDTSSALNDPLGSDGPADSKPVFPADLEEFFGNYWAAERIFKNKKSPHLVSFARIYTHFDSSAGPQDDWAFVESLVPRGTRGAIGFSKCRSVEDVVDKLFIALRRNRLVEFGADLGIDDRYEALAALRDEREREALAALRDERTAA